jgi:hypothetical protein
MVLLTTVVSCLAIGTGGEKIDNKPTLGEELMDLQKARYEGAISQKEYEELKDKLKKNYK